MKYYNFVTLEEFEQAIKEYFEQRKSPDKIIGLSFLSRKGKEEFQRAIMKAFKESLHEENDQP